MRSKIIQPKNWPPLHVNILYRIRFWYNRLCGGSNNAAKQKELSTEQRCLNFHESHSSASFFINII